MNFSTRLFELRKQNGLSQEEMAEKLNVSRQTISKWEMAETSPDLQTAALISERFDISLDELVLGKQTSKDFITQLATDENKTKAKKGAKIAGLIFGCALVIDFISMIIYFILFGFPK